MLDFFEKFSLISFFIFLFLISLKIVFNFDLFLKKHAYSHRILGFIYVLLILIGFLLSIQSFQNINIKNNVLFVFQFVLGLNGIFLAWTAAIDFKLTHSNIAKKRNEKNKIPHSGTLHDVKILNLF